MRNFVYGATYPFRALAVIGRAPELWRFIVVPILINIVAALALYGGLLWLGLNQIDAVVGSASGVAAAFAWLLRALLVLGLLILIGFVLVRFGVVLGSPWYGKLSERLEQQITGTAPPAEPLNPLGIGRDLLRAVGFELKKLLLVIVISAVLLVINLVPAAGQIIGTVGGFGLGALIACLDFFDGPLERRRLSFRAKLGAVRRGMPASLGFGLACFVLISIPLLNLVFIPICVAAGTLFFCDYLRLPNARSR